MRRGRIFFLLAVIVLIGLVAVVLVYQRFLRPAQTTPGESATANQTVDIVNVFVTTQKINRGNAVTRDQVSLVPIQRQLFLQGMLTDLKDVEGKLTKIDLPAGFILLDSVLTSSADQLSQYGSDTALVIPRGSVAIAIPIEKLTKASYPVQAGDHVNIAVVHSVVDLDTDFQSKLPNIGADILAPGVREPASYLTAGPGNIPENTSGSAGRVETIPGLGQPILVLPAESQRPRMVAQVVLQNVAVLGVGSYASGLAGQDQTPAAQTGTENVQQPPAAEVTPTATEIPNFVSLIVTPQDALMLTFLMANDTQFTLHLRSAGDDSRVQIEAETLQYYLNKYNVPIPVKLPYGLEPRKDNPNIPAITFNPTPTPVP